MSWNVAVNLAQLVVADASRSWLRNFRTVSPALGSMVILLALAGGAALSALGVGAFLQAQANDASVVHVYLSDSATDEQVRALIGRLRADPRVVSVGYVSSDDALRTARRRPGLSELVDAAGANPFPNSLDVRARGLADLRPLVLSLAGQPAVDPGQPTSYDPRAYRSLQWFFGIAEALTAGALIVLAMISVALTANGIRGTALARSDDIEIMRLVGASGWMVGGPFVVEGMLTGCTAGLVSGGALLALCGVLQAASAAAFTPLLPGVGEGAVLSCASALPLAGAAVGAVAALAAMRGLRA